MKDSADGTFASADLNHAGDEGAFAKLDARGSCSQPCEDHDRKAHTFVPDSACRRNRPCPDGCSNPVINPGPVVEPLSFARWRSLLTVSVLRARTPFACFLKATLRLQRSLDASVSPAFPLPMPFDGVFAKMPSGFSSSQRKRCHFRRAIHVIVMALNFWWSGNSFLSLELLRRTPSASQRKLLRRIAGLVLADGPVEPFEVLTRGRRFHQLAARLSELSDVVAKLGVGSGPYEKTYPGHEVPLDNSRYIELELYMSLNASRLKIVGTGHFDASGFLTPELDMAYRFPDSLLRDYVPEKSEYPQFLDDQSEVVALAHVWDAKGLLRIHDVDLQKERKYELARVFNCLKISEVDRQIGDRRGRNACECRLHGPSASLPTGPDLLDVRVENGKESLVVICTDRRDFYHQFKTSWNRTLSNSIGPAIPLSLLRDTEAIKLFAAAKNAKKPPRIAGGDKLGVTDRQLFKRCDAGIGMIAFSSIFQGDHAGVEIATSAHEGLLRSVGLLDATSRLTSDAPFLGDSLAEGLVTEDYFAISKVPRNAPGSSAALKCLATSKKVYSDYALLGSDDKDVCGERRAKIIGASVNSAEETQSRGHVLVSSPAQKRYALSWISLQIAQLSHTSDSLHLCAVGGWTSVLMFRRPVMSLLQKAFSLVDMVGFDSSHPKLVKLSRPVATELTLLAVLAPLCTADLAADFSERIYATDASMQKGAIVSSPLPVDIHEVLWRSCRSKGAYSKLLTPFQAVLSRCWDFEEVDEPKTCSVKRPLAYRFDFIEIFSGAATVTAKMKNLGFSVGCPIDISYDVELDMTQVRVLEWLCHLISNHFVLAWMVEPPCTTFSVMRRPPLRSKLQPFGFDLDDEQTSVGTLLAHRALQVVNMGRYHGVTGVLENPWTSKVKFLPAWKEIVCQKGVQVVRCDSCAYGSIHLKAFVFMVVWGEVDAISFKSDGTHEHVQIQGSYTKQSATYVDDLAEALAQVMVGGVKRLKDFSLEQDKIRVEGLENLAVNELALSLPWELDSVWTLKATCHINLLELSAVLKLATRLIRLGKSVRVLVLVDSNVIKCAASKGRSSARALKALSKLAALCIVGGLYVVFAYVPTRLNVADDPTRSVPVRCSIPGMDLAAWDRLDLFSLASRPRLRCWAVIGCVSAFCCRVRSFFILMIGVNIGPLPFHMVFILVPLVALTAFLLPILILTPRWATLVKAPWMSSF